MIDLAWLSDRLCAVVEWQVAHPNAAEHPDAPEVPWAGQRIWGLFLAFHATRSVGMAPSAISHAEIKAYSIVTGDPVRPWELEIIRAIDGAWLKATRDPNGAPSQVSKVPMTMQTFDMMFG